MYCVHCGAQGAVAFCPDCGQRQKPDVASDQRESNRLQAIACDEHVHEPIPILAIPAQPVVCWTDSIQYEIVLANPEARKRIAAAGRTAVEGVTGEDLLAVFDAVSPIGFSLGKLTHAILPIYDKLGIKTGHASQGIYDAPSGRVMLAVLCTLAAKSLTIADVHQDPEKCSLTAEIPSGLITNRGKLHSLIEVHELYISVSLAITISGQWYDWGKSKRMINEIYSSVYGDLTNQQSGRAPQYRRVA